MNGNLRKVGDIPRTHAELLLALKAIPAFAASFAFVVMFWHAHYRWSRRYGLEDGVSVLLSPLLAARATQRAKTLLAAPATEIAPDAAPSQPESVP